MLVLQELLSYAQTVGRWLSSLGSQSLSMAGCVLLGLVLAAWLSKPACPEGSVPALTAAIAPSVSWMPIARWTCVGVAPAKPVARTLPAAL